MLYVILPMEYNLELRKRCQCLVRGISSGSGLWLFLPSNIAFYSRQPITAMATFLKRAFKSITSAIAYCYFNFRDDHTAIRNINYNMTKGRPLSLQTVNLKVRMCCSGCERVVKNAIHKLRGIDSVEIDLDMEKVTVVGYVDQNKVLKAVRKAGKRAEFWPYPNPPLYFTSANHYFKDTNNEFKESYNYYRHGYNVGERYGNIPVTHRGDDKVSNMFNDDNVNACCLM